MTEKLKETEHNLNDNKFKASMALFVSGFIISTIGAVLLVSMSLYDSE